MIRLVDDQRLGLLLRTAERPDDLLTDDPGDSFDDTVYTTGYWYVRLCQAVLMANARGGVLSAPFAALPVQMRERAIRSLLELPDRIGLVSLRELAPLIGRLRSRYQLNILGMEALAAGIHLSANHEDVIVHLSARSPKLEEALRSQGLTVRIA